MSARLVAIPAADVAKYWAHVRPMLQGTARRSSGKVRPDDLLRDIRAKRLQVWAAEVDGAIVAAGLTEIINFPRKRVCRFIAAVGRDHLAWLELLPLVETWARAEGCTGFEAMTRPGWEKPLRTLGYRKSHVLLEKDI